MVEHDDPQQADRGRRGSSCGGYMIGNDRYGFATRWQKVEWEALAAKPDAASTPDLDVLLLTRLIELYRRTVGELERVLEGPDRAEAINLIR